MTGWIETRPRKGSLYQTRLVACSISCMGTQVCLHVNILHPRVLPISIDASDFLRKHPWPGRAISDTFDDSSHRRGNFSKKFMSTLKIACGKTGDEEDMYDDEDREDERVLFDVSENNQTEVPFYWSSALQDGFREELEK